MSIYNLDPDEAVIMQAPAIMQVTNNQYGDYPVPVDLVLTNKHLIQVTKGRYAGANVPEKYPLHTLRVYNKKANVIVGEGRNRNKQLELYFSDFERRYCFTGSHAESKWASAIIKAHKECMDSIRKAQKAKAGTIGIAQALDFAKLKVLPSRVSASKTIKCSRCGAELNGSKGDTVVCSYCKTPTVI